MRRRAFCQSLIATATAATLTPSLLRAESAASARDLPARTPAGGATTVPAAAVRELAAALRGRVLLPGDAAYDPARRIWNGMIDRRPALIIQPLGAADVVQSVQFARSHDLLFAVRGGGHSVSGQSVCDGGLMLDCSPMAGVRVDPGARRARVEPGVLLGALDHEAQAFGLATTAGTVSHTGASGLTLGGGFGRLCRKFGLACDNMIGADVVTADGRLLKVSDVENPDLLWGLRGGGGNFGVVTSFEYRLHPVGPRVIGGNLIYPFEQARDVLGFYGEFCATAPDELCVDYAIVAPPGAQPMIVVEVTFVGDPAIAERVLAPLRAFGKPRADRIGPADYADLQRSTDAGTRAGLQYYLKSGFLTRVEPGLVGSLLGGFEPSPDRAMVLTFQQLGGAMGRVAPDATAFSFRDANFALLMMSGWTDPAKSAANMEAVRDYWAKVSSYTSGFYVNSYTPEEEQRIRANYRGNFDRLVQLKNRYDPSNFFRLNVNVRPTA